MRLSAYESAVPNAYNNDLWVVSGRAIFKNLLFLLFSDFFFFAECKILFYSETRKTVKVLDKIETKESRQLPLRMEGDGLRPHREELLPELTLSLAARRSAT